MIERYMFLFIDFNMAQFFNVVDLTSDDHIYETVKYVGSDCSSSICFCAISQPGSALISAIVEGFSPVGYFILSTHDVLNPVDYSNGNDPNLIFIKSTRNEVYKNGDITFVKFAEGAIINQSTVSNIIIEKVSPKIIYVLDSQKKSLFINDSRENSVYTLGNDNMLVNTLSSPNQVSGLSASLLIESMIKKINCTIELLCEPDDKLSNFSFAEWTRKILSVIDNDQVKNLSIWSKYNFDDVLNYALHNLIILKGGILAATK